MSPKPQRSWWDRTLLWACVALAACVLGVTFWLCWSRFHPSYTTPIVGPAGSRYRAFIADVGGFGLCELLVSASDWPHTFSEPFVLGDVFDENLYDAAAVFWSQDGSVLVLCVKPHAQTAEVFEAAYDFQAHTSLNHRHDQIAALIQARGGLGPKSDAYSEVRNGPGLTMRSGR